MMATKPGARPTTTRRPQPLTAARLGLPAEPRKAGKRAGLTAHVRATLDTNLRVLLAEQATAGQADQPESVHQMRVACRRMRVALRLDRAELGPSADRVRAELAWLGTLLGEVRDLDVLCDRLGADAATLSEADLPGFAEIVAALLSYRATAAAELVAGLTKPRYRALLRLVAAEATMDAEDVEDGTGPSAAELVRRPLRALRSQFAAIKQTPSDAAWHTLRIRVKRVRYAAEVAARLATRANRSDLRELSEQARELQDVLGDFQDTVAAEDHLRGLLANRSDELSPAALLVLGRLVERQVARRDALRGRLPAASAELARRTSG